MSTPQIIPVIASRDLFPEVLNQSGLHGVGVEVGVLKAEYSEWILDHWKDGILHSVDPWRHFGDEYVDGHNLPDALHESNYQAARARLVRFGGRSQIHRMTSREASLLFKDDSLDFVYLDAQHHYEAVCEDIACWFPKVRKTGIIGGHDFFEDGDYPFGRFGVKKAVLEFAEKIQRDVLVSSEAFPPPFEAPSWFVVKA
jgi:hypothetical protein